MNKKILLLTSFVLLLVMLIIIRRRVTLQKSLTATTTAVASTSSQDNPKYDINQDFTFTIGSGFNKVSLKYTLLSAESAKDIVIRGQTAHSVPGRAFLILSLKLTNSQNKGVLINTRDYVRMSPAGSSDWLAADIHNDPVEVQAISSQFTRIGFAIDDTVHDFKLQIGDINDKKSVIDFSL